MELQPGYGGDILTTLHYYVIGDPLDLLSIACPTRYAVYLYSFLSLFRLYLAGWASAPFAGIKCRARPCLWLWAACAMCSLLTASLWWHGTRSLPYLWCTCPCCF